jgi:hypothetical protein
MLRTSLCDSLVAIKFNDGFGQFNVVGRNALTFPLLPLVHLNLCLLKLSKGRLRLKHFDEQCICPAPGSHLTDSVSGHQEQRQSNDDSPQEPIPHQSFVH